MTYYYVFEEMTGVITGPADFPIVPGIGVQLPGNAFELPELLPAAEPGYVWVWRNGAASQLIDLRNRLVYRKDNGMPFYWNELGPLPEYLTAIPRPGEYYVWGTDDWVLDAALERAGQVYDADVERDKRLRDVVIRVAPLQYAYELGEATSDQLTTLQALKRYAVTLAQIELQAGYPSTINWPVAPAKFVVSPAA